MSQNKNNELRLFISSTFRDLQEEREHLIKKIFPEIRSLCRERGVTFTEVDLRWGITEEEAEREGIIRICLEEIDRCRPYFIGILGERYGWIPPDSETLRMLDLFPTLSDAIFGGTSITEMEIVHGLLADPTMTGCVFFYFRDASSTPVEFIDVDPHSAQRLKQLKETVRQSTIPVRENFTTPVELGEWVRRDMLTLIEREYPERETPGALELKRRSHRAFAASRRRAYVPQPEYRRRFDEWLRHSKHPLVISGESGLGKSSLIAHLIEGYASRHSDALVIEHYVGASEGSGSAIALMRHIIEEISERFSIVEEIATDPEQLERDFITSLHQAAQLAAEEGITVLIALDALNQLDDPGASLTWLPKKIPPEIRLVVTTTPGGSCQRLQERDWEELHVGPLRDEKLRSEIVEVYLAEFHKSISPAQLQRIISDNKGASPLYLRMIAEELRLHGEHESLDDVIDRYRSAENLDDLFWRVLERMEQDYGREILGEMLALIWASDGGLSEAELLDLTGTSRLELSRLLFALDYHLMRNNGLLGFFHGYLHRSVVGRYVASPHDLHLRLAEYFIAQPVSSRGSRALVYHLFESGSYNRLRDALVDLPVLLTLADAGMNYEVLRYWRLMGEKYTMAEEYTAGLERFAASGGDRRLLARALQCVIALLGTAGRFREIESLALRLLDLAQTFDDNRLRASAYNSLALSLAPQSRYEEVLDYAATALKIGEELADWNIRSVALTRIGLVHKNKAEYDQALECFEQVMKINTEMNSSRGVWNALGNIGIVYFSRGEYSRALELYEEQHRIAERLGDKSLLSTTLANRANARRRIGDYTGAEESYRRQIEIDEEIDDRNGLANGYGNLGLLHWCRGEYDEAIECYREAVAINDALGQRKGSLITVGNIGLVYRESKRYEEALACFDEAAEGHRELGFRYGLTYWLDAKAHTLLDIVSKEPDIPEYVLSHIERHNGSDPRMICLHEAMRLAEESIDMSRAIGKPDTLVHSSILRARCLAEGGELDRAIAAMEELFDAPKEEWQLPYLHLEYGKLKLRAGSMQDGIQHLRTSIEGHEALLSVAMSSEVQSRLQEARTILMELGAG